MKKSIAIIAIILSFYSNASAERLPAASISDAIINYVSEKNRIPKEQVVIDFKAKLLDEIVPDGNVALQIHTGAHTNITGFTPFGVTIMINDAPYKKFIVNAHVDAKVKAFMASRWINHHEAFTLDNLELVEIYRSRVPLDYIGDQESLRGKVAKVALPKGRIVSYSLVDVPPLVKARDIVDVILETDNLKIMAKGAALMDGRLGDVIKLRLLESKREIYGKVANATTVNVKMPN